jgi:sigma-B regulation protein RsbU (phosphoserine phosphatase)
MAEPDAVLRTYLGISYQSPEDKVLRLLIELGGQFVGAEEGSLLVLDDEARELVFAMTVGSGASEEALVGQRVPLGAGITGLAAQTHEVQIGAPTFDTDQAAEHKTAEGRPKSVLAAPMLIGDRLVGVITAVSFRPDKRFGSADATLYGRIAAVAGVVVEQRRKLSAIEALQRGEAAPAPVNEAERLDGQILDTVSRLVAARPGVKARIARLLADVESLMGE